MAVLPTSSDLSPEQAPSESITTSPIPLIRTLADCLIMSSLPAEEKDCRVNELERRVKELEETVQERNEHIQHNIDCIKNHMKRATELERIIQEKDHQSRYLEKDEAKAGTSRETFNRNSVALLHATLTMRDQAIAHQTDLLRRNEEVKDYMQGEATRYRENIEQISTELHMANTIIGERNATNDSIVEQVVELEEKNKKLEEENECLTRRVLYLESQFGVRRTEGMITVPGRGLMRSYEVIIDEAGVKDWKGDRSSEDACS